MILIDKDEFNGIEHIIRIEIDLCCVDRATGEGYQLDWECIPEELREVYRECEKDMTRCFKRLEQYKPRLIEIFRSIK